MNEEGTTPVVSEEELKEYEFLNIAENPFSLHKDPFKSGIDLFDQVYHSLLLL